MIGGDGRGWALGAAGLLALGAVVATRDDSPIEVEVAESRWLPGGILLSVEHHVRPPRKRTAFRPWWTEQLVARLLRYDPLDLSYEEVGRVQAPRVERHHLTLHCSRNLEALEARVGRALGIFSVSDATLEKALRGRGYGRLMYEAVAFAAADDGAALAPDACAHGYTSPRAGRVWESLVRRFPHVGSPLRRRRNPVVVWAAEGARTAA